MSTEEILGKYKPLIRKNILSIALASLGMIFLGYGLIGLISGKAGSNDIVFESGSEANQSSSSAKIFVDIEGAVVKSGVYELPSDSRLQDALVAAGGLSLEANRDFVAKNFNLAQKLKDGAKIYVPYQNQISNISPRGEAGKDQKYDESVGIQDSKLININAASSSELDTLSGIGPVTAQKIIDNRPYETTEDLLTKKIVGSSTFEKIKEKITVY